MTGDIVAFDLVGGSTSTKLFELGILILIAIILYLVYKFTYHRDFGVPVKRRLLVMRLQVVNDQVAFVPFWWSDIQVQRAVRAHWKKTMRETSELPDPGPPGGTLPPAAGVS